MKSLHDIVDLEGYHQIQDVFIQKRIIPKILMLPPYLDQREMIVLNIANQERKKVKLKTEAGIRLIIFKDI